jgi:hypothetical protein
MKVARRVRSTLYLADKKEEGKLGSTPYKKSERDGKSPYARDAARFHRSVTVMR